MVGCLLDLGAPGMDLLGLSIELVLRGFAHPFAPGVLVVPEVEVHSAL